MLTDNYRTFESTADTMISDWRRIPKNTLFYKYIEYEETNPRLAEAYVSAIVCRYWDWIGSLYAKSQPVFTEQDCYDWLMNSVIYTLKHRKWLDPNCVLYGDPNGPDKALNICVKSERLTAFQVSNRYKRKGNALTLSLDKQTEEFGDYYTPECLTYTMSKTRSNDYDYLITESFAVKDYFKSFMMDLILHDNVFETTVDEQGNSCTSFSRKRLLHLIRTADEGYFRYFSRTYHIPLEKVKKAYSYCADLSTDVYTGKVNRVTKEISKLLKGQLV